MVYYYSLLGVDFVERTLSERTAAVDYFCGLLLWTTSVDYACGLRLWTTSADYACGLLLRSTSA